MTLPASASLPNYPAFLNARQYDAEFLRMVQECGAFGEGIAPFDQSKDATVVGMGANVAGDLLCTTGGSGLNVTVAAGNAWVKGDARSTQGLYFCYVDVAKTVTLAANASGNPRIDAIILQVRDADVSGANSDWQVTSQQGTAAVGATLTNLTGAPGQGGGPALQASALVLAYVLVPTGFAGPFVTATHILDRRFFAYRPGRVLGYIKSSSADSAGAGDKIGPLTVCGNGVNDIELFARGHAGNNGGVGVNTFYKIRDAAAGLGSAIDGTAWTQPNSGYGAPLHCDGFDAAVAGRKSYYYNLQSGAGAPTDYSGTFASARSLLARYK